jgi:hypothetical protein
MSNQSQIRLGVAGKAVDQPGLALASDAKDEDALLGVCWACHAYWSTVTFLEAEATNTRQT